LPALPDSRQVSILHGDYRLDNTIVDTSGSGGIAAIVDWEMSTLGDPLADVGLLLTYWNPVSAPVIGGRGPSSPGTRFPDASYVRDRYQAASGSDLEQIGWYEALGHFKLAVIAKTIQMRQAQGHSVGVGNEQVASAIPALVERGLELCP
jgi:aminoglycoside phosphotransferase (APT) family kinase protein